MLQLMGIGLLGIASLVLLAMVATRKLFGQDRAIMGGAGGVLGVVALLLLGFEMFTIVPSGHVGVPVLLGRVQDAYLQEGFHFVNPLSNVIHMSVRTHTYTMSARHEEGNVQGDDSIEALSKNGMSMHMDVSVPHRLVPSSAAWVYKNLGPDYDAQIVRPAISTAIREATANFTEDEAYSSKRVELVKAMKERLESQIASILATYGNDAPGSVIVFPEVQLRNVGLPDTVQRAINEKIATEQKIVQAKNEATRKEIEAGGIKKFQDIVSQGITPDLLKWKGIESTETIALSNNAKVVIIGNHSDELPVLLNGDGNDAVSARVDK